MGYRISNYQQAASAYAGRVDPHLGRKIRTYAWMKHDPERDCFVCSEVMTSWADGSKRLPKEKWRMSPYVEIFRDRVVILRSIHNNCLEAFGVTNYAPNTNKFQGRRWTTFTYKVETNEYGRKYNVFQEGQSMVCEAPLVLKDGVLTPVNPPKERVVDNELRKEFNRKIVQIRNLLKVRTKLGAFRGLSLKELETHAIKKGYSNRWSVYSNPQEFLRLLNDIAEDNIESFYPALWVSIRYWTYEDRSIADKPWVDLFNNAVDRMRERMKQELGVVKYVEVANPDLSTDG